MKLWNNKWLWTGILFTAAAVLSAIKVVVLPQGGSVTYFSLLMLWLITFFFGFRHGLIFSVLFGCVKLYITYATGETVNFVPMALLLEYPLAHGVFCLGAFLWKKDRVSPDLSVLGADRAESRYLRRGYLVGLCGQFTLYVLSATLFYPNYKPGFWANLTYNIVYDGSCLLIEGAATVLLLSIPAVSEAICYLKYVANHEEEDETLECF